MENQNYPDSKLVEEVRNGNLSSFEILVKRYEKQLFSYTFKKLKDHDTTEDVVQETFIRIFKNIQVFDLSKPFVPWMYTIAKNLSFDIIRKGKHRAQLDWDIEDTHESIVTKIIRNEAFTYLWNAIKSLPDMYKQPLLGYYFANLSYKQLAYQLNISENTIKTRLRRAKNYLKVELGRKGYG